MRFNRITMGACKFPVFTMVIFCSCLSEIKATMTYSSTLGNVSNFDIFPQKDFFLVFMEKTMTFNVGYSVLCTNKTSEYTLSIKSYDTSVIKVKGQSTFFIKCHNASQVSILHMQSPDRSLSLIPQADESLPKDQIVASDNITVTLYGDLIGRTVIGFRLTGITMNTTDLEKVTPVTVLRLLRPIDTAFRVFIYFFMVFVTLAFGCKLDLKVVKENLKRPIAPVIGFLCQYLLMPLIAYGIAKLVTTYSVAVSLGIFLSGCCPGGGVSNIYTHLLGGDLSLSITMTTISNIAALGMFPLWMYTLGQQFIDEKVNMKIPFVNMFTTLLTLILPIFVGMFIKWKLPKVKKILMKIITPVTVVTVIFLLSVGIYSNLFIFRLLSPRVIFAGCLLPYFGYILSGIACFILRQDWTKTKTIIIETGIQNVGVAMVMMFLAFPPPDGELAAVGPIASGIMTPLPLFCITVPYLIYKRCNKDKYAEVSTKTEEISRSADVTIEMNGKEIKPLENGKEEESVDA